MQGKWKMNIWKYTCTKHYCTVCVCVCVCVCVEIQCHPVEVACEKGMWTLHIVSHNKQNSLAFSNIKIVARGDIEVYEFHRH